MKNKKLFLFISFLLVTICVLALVIGILVVPGEEDEQDLSSEMTPFNLATNVHLMSIVAETSTAAAATDTAIAETTVSFGTETAIAATETAIANE